MVKVELYTGEKTYILGNGEVGTREVVEKYFPAATTVRYVAVTDEFGETLMAMDPLSRKMSEYHIDPETPVETALQMIEDILNADPEPSPPSAEERIAAAMEFQNLMML